MFTAFELGYILYTIDTLSADVKLILHRYGGLGEGRGYVPDVFMALHRRFMAPGYAELKWKGIKYRDLYWCWRVKYGLGHGRFFIRDRNLMN